MASEAPPGDPWGNDALLELIPEPLIPVYQFLTSPVVIMLGAAVFLIVIAVVLSPSDSAPQMSEEEMASTQAAYDAYMRAKATKGRSARARGDEDEEDEGDADDYDNEEEEDDDEDEDEDDEDDDGIQDAMPDPVTNKFHED